jgi:DNA-binding NarL/FixJ family response regulator
MSDKYPTDSIPRGAVRIYHQYQMAIRILLANHQPIIRSELRFLLEREVDFDIVAEAADGKEAIILAEYKRPSVALLEIQLPQMNGIALAKELLSKGHSPKVIFVSSLIDVGYVMQAFRAGARGYVHSDSAATDLAPAIRTIAADRLFVSPIICDKFAAESQCPPAKIMY